MWRLVLNLYKISMQFGDFSALCAIVLPFIMKYFPLRKETSSREDRKQTKKRVSGAFISCILIVVLLLSLFIIKQIFNFRGMIPEEVPHVEGTLYADAVESLQEAKFSEKVICEDESENWSDYVVEKQEPSGGETSLTKTRVKLFLVPAKTRTEEPDTYDENPENIAQVLSSIVLVVDPEFSDSSISPSCAYSGDEVELHIHSEVFYHGFGLKLIDRNGNELAYEREDWGIFTFIMPDCDVTVYLSASESVPPMPTDFAEPETPCNDPNCPTRSFSDLDPGAWYHDAVDFVIDNNLLSGYNGKFLPDGTLTRAEVATVLCYMTGWPDVIVLNSSITDVSDDAWYAVPVSWAVGNGIMCGYADQTFRPDEPVTIEQFITILWRFASSPADHSPYQAFTDEDKISPYAAAAVGWAAGEKFLRFTDGTLNAHKNITRAEAAEILKNYIIGY